LLKDYGSDRIRNVGFFGHGGCGKTTVCESLLYLLKQNNRVGRVDDGTSLLDYDEDEVNRKISLNLSLGFGEYKDSLLNLVDTPGYADFIGEVYSAVRAIDSAVVVVDSTSGVEVGTEMVWKQIERENLPRIILLTKLQKEHADFYKTLDEVQKKFGIKAVALSLPIGSEQGYTGVVDLLANKAYAYNGLEAKEVPIPAEVADQVTTYREKLIESAADADENLMNKFLEGGTISAEEALPAVSLGIKQGRIYPVLGCDGHTGIAVQHLLDFITSVMPAAREIGDLKATDLGTKQERLVPRTAESPTIAFVFKTVSESHIGDINYVRVLSGVLKPGEVMTNSRTERDEKLNQLYLIKGKERVEVNQLRAGQIGGLVKLKTTKTGDTLSDQKQPSVIPPIAFPQPAISVAIVPRSKGDEEKMSTGMSRLREEDPTFSFMYDAEGRQQLISGLGELHLDVIIGRLKRKFGTEVDLVKPRIHYRETVTRKVEAQGKHKKQTGGRGQYGDCWIRLEPKARGEGFEFAEEIYGGSIPAKYIPSIEKGVVEKMTEGVLAGYQMVDMKCTVYDGSYHDVDSSDIAFKLAGRLAFENASEKAGLTLLEPIMNVEITVPAQYMGAITGDLSSRRGIIQGMETEGSLQIIRATVPEAEMYKYSNSLRSMTQGRGYFTMSPSHYQEVPKEISLKIIEESKKEKEKQQ
jgi:elongation factor G